MRIIITSNPEEWCTKGKQIATLAERLEYYKEGVEAPIGTRYHAWLGTAETLEEQGDTDGAINAYKITLNHDRRSIPAWINLGILLSKKGDLNGAKKAYQAACDHDPKNSTAWSNFSLGLHLEGDLEEATRACQMAVELKPNNLTAWLNPRTLSHEDG